MDRRWDSCRRHELDHSRLIVHDVPAVSAPVSGLFVVLEGGEGVGKTTQWQRLSDRLSADGHDVVSVREPGGTGAGDAIRTILLDSDGDLVPECEALLFAASRAQLVREVIQPALARDAVVLVDRFLLSTYAYQGAGRGLSLDALQRVNAFATADLAPHCTLLLTMSLDDALSRMQLRGAADRLERESLAFHQRVQHAFIAAAEPGWQSQHPEIGPVYTIDASGHPDVVTARCLDQLTACCPSRFVHRVSKE